MLCGKGFVSEQVGEGTAEADQVLWQTALDDPSVSEHDRPVGLKAALRRSANISADVVPLKRNKAGAKSRLKSKPKEG